jgi:hypothetical protein
VNSRQRLAFRYSQRRTDEAPPNLFPSEIAAATGRKVLGDRPRNITAEYTNTLTPSIGLTARLGFSRVVLNLANQSLGFRPSSLGLPKTIDERADVLLFPQFSATGYVRLGGGDHRHSALNTLCVVKTHLFNKSTVSGE